MKETMFETMAGGTSDGRRSSGGSHTGHANTVPTEMPRGEGHLCATSVPRIRAGGSKRARKQT